MLRRLLLGAALMGAILGVQNAEGMPLAPSPGGSAITVPNVWIEQAVIIIRPGFRRPFVRRPFIRRPFARRPFRRGGVGIIIR